MNEFAASAPLSRDTADPGTSVASESKRPSAAAWINQARGFIVDLDGTLVREGTVMAGAIELLQRISDRYVIVSNNSTDTAIGLARRLRKLGLPVRPERLILAGEHTIRHVAERHAGARIMLIASPAIRSYARKSGLKLVDGDAAFVVLARDRRFTYAKLRAAANELRKGARLVVANVDASHPSADGGLVPETGALMAALVACAGVQPTQIVGKPDGLLFWEGLRQLGVQPAEALVIGDNPATDAVGAVRLGMRYLLVGMAQQADAPSLAALLQLQRPDHTHDPGAAGGE